MARVGVFGGTFDPIHIGHLIVAELAREQLRLDRVLFVVSALPPHKQNAAVTEGRHRLEMVRLAIAGHPSFSECDLELSREGVSYTSETLRALRAASPDDDLILLIGADILPDLPQWHEPNEIARLADIAVARRPDHLCLDFAALAPHFTDDAITSISERVIEIPLIEISSTDLRRRMATGRSIRYQVPAAVAAYIDAHGLYRET